MGDGDKEPQVSPVRDALDYQKLFLGACAVISLLAGSLYGSWDKSSDDTRRVDIGQWKELGEHSVAIQGLLSRMDRFERDGDDREKRIRELERESYRKK